MSRAPDDGHLTRRVAKALRRQIVEGDLAPGDKLPSQKALEGRFNVSTVTVRNAVEELEDEGLIAKRQGAHTLVHDRDPTHRLVVTLLAAGDRVAEPPLAFAMPGRLRRERASRRSPASRHVAGLLHLAEGTVVVERSFRLFDGEEPVLTSTSYLPPALVGDGTGPVPDVDVGQLALSGRAVRSVSLRLWARMPDPGEFAALGMVKGTPVQVLTHRLLAEGNREHPDDWEVPAAVEVVSRGDRVFVDIDAG